MSFGIIEVISLLLGLVGFGVQANPKAPTADQSLAVRDARRRRRRALRRRERDPEQLQGAAEPARTSRRSRPRPSCRSWCAQMIGADRGRRAASRRPRPASTDDRPRRRDGVRPDRPAARPQLRRRRCTASSRPRSIEKIAKMAQGRRSKAGTGMVARHGRRASPRSRVTKDGVLLAGHREPRARPPRATPGRRPRTAPGTNLGYAADVINGQAGLRARDDDVAGRAQASALTEHRRPELRDRHDPAPQGGVVLDVPRRHRLDVDRQLRRPASSRCAMMSDGVMDMLQGRADRAARLREAS